MSLSTWKELAEKKTKAGQNVNQLYDAGTEEKIRSKTTDQDIAKTFSSAVTRGGAGGALAPPPQFFPKK